MKFKDKVAVVTGGNSGIGEAIAHEFAKEGAKVAIFGRNQETLEKVAADLGDCCLAVRGDVSKLEDLDRFYQEIQARFGAIDHLIANAGISQMAHLADVDEAFFDRHFNVNVKGCFFTVQKAVPHMNDGGTIVLISSISGYVGWPAYTVYSATKAAVSSFTRTMSRDLIHRKIRVNAISPGAIVTPIVGKIFEDPKVAEAAAQRIEKVIPAGRRGESEEIAKVAAFLSSSESSYILAEDIVVDGGVTRIGTCF